MKAENEILQQFIQAFIMYEMASHNVDPRKTLDGTSLRLKPLEGYKYDIYDKGKKLIKAAPPYVPAVMAMLPGGNLVSYYQKGKIQAIIEKEGSAQFEHALSDLYEGNDDQNAFEELVAAIGGSFDVLGFLYFLKDCNKYLPIRSSLFDDRFKLLGFESDLEGHCTWDKYNDFIGLIEKIREILSKTVNEHITLLDAHSFVWILPWLSEYLDQKVQLVENKKHGTGVVVGLDRDLIQVKFGKKIISFGKDEAFQKGYLKIIPISVEYSDVTTSLSEKAIEVVSALLQLISNRQSTITYSELSSMTTSCPDPHLELPKLLDDINRVCGKLNLPCISALVVNKETGLPGGGFKKICVEEFGYDARLSKEEIFEKELLSIGRCSEWNRLAEKLGLEMPGSEEDLLPEEFDGEHLPIMEGAKKQITVNAYERDPKAVKICKDYYMHRDGKLVCQICKFDFGAVYGAEYSNKVHIHHIKPISEIGKEYEVDPFKDLIPVCPNCHMVLHANGGISVEALLRKLGGK